MKNFKVGDKVRIKHLYHDQEELGVESGDIGRIFEEKYEDYFGVKFNECNYTHLKSFQMGLVPEYSWEFLCSEKPEGTCNSIKECLRDARNKISKDELLKYNTVIRIEELENYNPRFEGDDVVEYLRRQADIEFGEELCGEWLLNSQEKDLAKELNETLQTWLIKNNEHPYWAKAIDTKIYDIKTGKEITK